MPLNKMLILKTKSPNDLFFFYITYTFSVVSNVPDIIFHLTRTRTTRRTSLFTVISESVSVPGPIAFLVALL